MTIVSSYYRISNEMVISTHNIDNNILVDVDKDGKIIGIETIGKEFSLEVVVEIIKSFIYPEVITLPTGKPIMFKV